MTDFTQFIIDSINAGSTLGFFCLVAVFFYICNGKTYADRLFQFVP